MSNGSTLPRPDKVFWVQVYYRTVKEYKQNLVTKSWPLGVFCKPVQSSGETVWLPDPTITVECPSPISTSIGRTSCVSLGVSFFNILGFIVHSSDSWELTLGWVSRWSVLTTLEWIPERGDREGEKRDPQILQTFLCTPWDSTRTPQHGESDNNGLQQGPPVYHGD